MVVNLDFVPFGCKPKIGFKKERAELDIYFNFFLEGEGRGCLLISEEAKKRVRSL